LSARRTAIGAFQGALASVGACALGGAAIRGAVSAAGIDPDEIGETVFGCVLTAGLGQAPARQAAIAGGLPISVPATTVNKMCGSGMKAVMMAANSLRSGDVQFAVAGGLESMTNAPYLLPKARGGYRMGHGEILDHMFLDGLQSPWDGQMMGCFADETAKKYGIDRLAMDTFATESVRRSLAAIEAGAFVEEIVPVIAKSRKGEVTVSQDETPFTCDVARITSLKPAFRKDGTVTAASSSSISDGAAAVVMAHEAAARKSGLAPVARMVAQATHAHEPEWFTTAPVGAVQKVLRNAGWSVADVDLFEINEAFAVVTLAAIHDLGLDPEKVNVNGGACALGHPIGATGARIIATLISALRARKMRRGVAALCIGGGEATAIAIELM
jgi:acetyl-CoA C-acetyltransferase